MIITSQMFGLKELDKALQDMTKATARNVVLRALKAAGAPMAADMQAKAPTPGLANSISINRKLEPSTARTARAQGFASKSGVQIFIGPSYSLGSGGRLAHLFEFGTQERVRKSGGSTGRITMQPFVRPAWDSKQRVSLELLKSELWKEIQKANERAARKAAREAAKMARANGL